MDLVANFKWNFLLDTNPEELIVDVGQEFVAGSSILIRKWLERVD
jgi:hypothetical protein